MANSDSLTEATNSTLRAALVANSRFAQDWVLAATRGKTNLDHPLGLGPKSKGIPDPEGGQANEIEYIGRHVSRKVGPCAARRAFHRPAERFPGEGRNNYHAKHVPGHDRSVGRLYSRHKCRTVSAGCRWYRHHRQQCYAPPERPH